MFSTESVACFTRCQQITVIIPIRHSPVVVSEIPIQNICFAWLSPYGNGVIMSRNMAASEIFVANFTKNSSHEKSRVSKVFLNTLIFLNIAIASSSNLVESNKYAIHLKLATILYNICTQSSLSKL